MASLAKTGRALRFFVSSTWRFSRLGFIAKGLGKRSIDADFSGQRWLVTGASGGIGREIVKQVAMRGATVIAVARSRAKLERLVDDLSHLRGTVDPLVADLSLVGELTRIVDEKLAQERVDVLVNNVGVLLHEHALTEEGMESSYATNVLGHFVLTEQLVASGALNEDAVVVNMSSGGMYEARLEPARLGRADDEGFDGVMAYAHHKRCQAELTNHWQGEYGPQISFHVMHPGWVDTDGVKRSLPGFRKLFKTILRDESAGADTAIWLAAERPCPRPDVIWLDRERQPQHLSDATRNSKDVTADLVRQLRADAGAAAGVDRTFPRAV